MQTAPRSPRRCLGAVLLALVLLPAGCDTAEPPPLSGTFVGRFSESAAAIVIVTNGTDVRAYACDGSDDRVSVSEWFKGPLAGDAVDLPSVSNAARLAARLTGSAASGTVTLEDGAVLPFEAPREDGDAGFYLFKGDVYGEFYQAGWIVLPDGEQRGSVLVGSQVLPHASLDVPTRTATISGAGTVTAGKLVPSNVEQGFQGCFPVFCP